MISVVILTKNEEKNIGESLASVQWADEVIIIDDYSTDETVSLAKRLGASVYTRRMDGNFSSQRNFGLNKAKHPWVLFLDADERVSMELRDEIRETITSHRNRYAGYYLKRQDILFGKTLKYGETAGSSFLRLGRKDSGIWQGSVHEVWEVKGHIGMLHHPMSHYPHQTIAEFLLEVNFYTDLRAKELYHAGIRSSWFDIICYPAGKFLKNYLLLRGFLDGIPGMISALMMSFHSFLVRSKLWHFVYNKSVL